MEPDVPSFEVLHVLLSLSFALPCDVNRCIISSQSDGLMGARGLKRKVHESNEGEGSVWQSQLQSVLDISWDKFQRDQALVEPSLLRSVLINNTLRQVQSEVRTSLSGISGPRKLQAPPRVLPELRSQRECTPAGLGASISISAILKNLDSCRTSEGGAPASMSGFLQDATIDDLLLDIDTSVFNGEVNSFGSGTFSFPADELVRYLPSLSSSPSAPSSSGSREMHELEHIMDILVRT
uniref:SERTA domain-containing protein n=1 Tax=Pygocentrus nattereri TaxID=42514 RepID=A0A3B4CAJ3_PYGNA